MVSLWLCSERGTRKVILRHLINSSCQVQGIIYSDNEHSQKTIMKVSILKTPINDKLNKVKEFDENIWTWARGQRGRTKWNFDKRGRNCRRFSKNWLFLVKPAISNPVNISFTSSKSSEARVKLPNFEIPKFNGNIIKIAMHDNENINEVEKFTYLKSF